jgi:hypothetical protein
MARNAFWTKEVPIWVSRKTSDGVIAQFAVSGWLFFLLALLLTLNLLVWSVIGLVEAVQWVL